MGVQQCGGFPAHPSAAALSQGTSARAHLQAFNKQAIEDQTPDHTHYYHAGSKSESARSVLGQEWTRLGHEARRPSRSVARTLTILSYAGSPQVISMPSTTLFLSLRTVLLSTFNSFAVASHEPKETRV